MLLDKMKPCVFFKEDTCQNCAKGSKFHYSYRSYSIITKHLLKYSAV